jgi:hypothetical protein
MVHFIACGRRRKHKDTSAGGLLIMSRTRRSKLLGLLLSITVVVTGGLAWACVAVMSLTTVSPHVERGGTVTVIGRGFAQAAPVQIRLGGPDGRVLAVVPPPTTTMTSVFEQEVRIPSSVESGTHILVATQDYHNMNAGAPARAVIYVDSTPPVAPAGDLGAERATQLAARSGPGLASLVLIALGATAASLLLAALWPRAGLRPRVPTVDTA